VPVENALLFDTVEVRSSSLLVPTSSFNGLASLASLLEAPNGSIKPLSEPRPGGEVVPHFRERTSGQRRGESILGITSGLPVTLAESGQAR